MISKSFPLLAVVILSSCTDGADDNQLSTQTAKSEAPELLVPSELVPETPFTVRTTNGWKLRKTQILTELGTAGSFILTGASSSADASWTKGDVTENHLDVKTDLLNFALPPERNLAATAFVE